ncbi:hypothetical protein EVAR_37969_1 [Eumeta japonica]|uniref:Uncharacterized protein n=1 Tax=Eumeta variegata TaxID=151549 RepID=A0A4C1YZB1_EUMVA|nr:hypothetical protein EVAR_37969_1 [Eumeta japonica]
MTQFVKALDKNGQCFKFLSQKFPGLSTEKLKAGIFDGPQIRQLIKSSKDFEASMTEIEKLGWKSFVAVIQNFFGNFKANNYKQLVEEMLLNFKNLGCNMSLKVHYLSSHIDHFEHNLGDFSEEQGVSQGLVSKIVKEGQATEEAGTKIRQASREYEKVDLFM